jgi:hypothetical protein
MPESDPSPVPPPPVKARGAGHPLPWERENPHEEQFPLRGEKVAEGRSRVRGHLLTGGVMQMAT